ncbi:hypothetical protein, partial [Pseudomonas syringae group genomosp. 7]|uniref:hypothetical protein n=1 Tax=Pseudomonas syringae group genomosp. 7 TaxID=251699 RepID=UPI0037707698
VLSFVGEFLVVGVVGGRGDDCFVVVVVDAVVCAVEVGVKCVFVVGVLVGLVGLCVFVLVVVFVVVWVWGLFVVGVVVVLVCGDVFRCLCFVVCFVVVGVVCCWCFWGAFVFLGFFFFYIFPLMFCLDTCVWTLALILPDCLT